MKKINGRLEGVYTLLAPLSHIGESCGPESFLATQEVLGANGKPVEIFVYSGNAIRGMFRDCGAKYFLDKLSENTLQIPLEMFYLLFSGGAIGGDQKIDVDQARKIRQVMPVLSIFGGGVGNQILAGKMAVNDAYPISKECLHLISEKYRTGEEISWRQMTTERSYSRKDDAKDDNLRNYLQDETLLIEGSGQVSLLGSGDKEEKKKAKKDAPQQMRYTIEVLQAGARLWHRLDVRNFTELEFGALVSAIYEWSKSPHLGGQSRIGMGRCHLEYKWVPFGEPEEHFLTVSDDALLGPAAAEAKAKYDEYLSQYSAYLEEKKEGLVKMLAL